MITNPKKGQTIYVLGWSYSENKYLIQQAKISKLLPPRRPDDPNRFYFRKQKRGVEYDCSVLEAFESHAAIKSALENALLIPFETD